MDKLLLLTLTFISILFIYFEYEKQNKNAIHKYNSDSSITQHNSHLITKVVDESYSYFNKIFHIQMGRRNRPFKTNISIQIDYEWLKNNITSNITNFDYSLKINKNCSEYDYHTITETLYILSNKTFKQIELPSTFNYQNSNYQEGIRTYLEHGAYSIGSAFMFDNNCYSTLKYKYHNHIKSNSGIDINFVEEVGLKLNFNEHKIKEIMDSAILSILSMTSIQQRFVSSLYNSFKHVENITIYVPSPSNCVYTKNYSQMKSEWSNIIHPTKNSSMLFNQLPAFIQQISV